MSWRSRTAPDGHRSACTRKLQRLGGLCCMRMLGAVVDLELVDHLTAQAVPREHAPNRIPDHFVGTLHHQVGIGGRPKASRIATVAVGQLGFGLTDRKSVV